MYNVVMHNSAAAIIRMRLAIIADEFESSDDRARTQPQTLRINNT